jgi:hypothetical protein
MNVNAVTRRRNRPWFAILLTLVVGSSVHAAEIRRDHVRIDYDGVTEAYAEAIAATVAAARGLCQAAYGYDMPDVIRVRVAVDPAGRTRLFNDGVDSFSLTVRQAADLRKPAASGVFHIYGLCHEVAHLAMYRPIKDHSWLSTAGAEGWAHYLGSELVDKVYAREGMKLWPDRYDYRADGTQRLAAQLRQAKPSDIARGAQAWQQLVGIVGEKAMPDQFRGWGKAKVDPRDPAAAFKPILTAGRDEKKLAAWWQRHESLLIVKREGSEFAVERAKPDDLTGSPHELVHDDGESAGKSSIAGGGHAVRFSITDADAYLTRVAVFGSRYGAPTAPKENFRVWLCDSSGKEIAGWEFPYDRFARGAADWVSLDVEPTRVPREFFVFVAFNPAATKGVFVSYDGESAGNSFTGLPGGEPAKFSKGDWLIRGHVDRPKGTDALSPQDRPRGRR